MPSTKIKPCKLPSKLSDLLELALKDLAKVEKSKKYRVNMQVFHMPEEDETRFWGETRKAKPNGVCTVCMAGALLAGTCKVPRTTFENEIASPDLWSKLYAVDSLRTGHVCGAYKEINGWMCDVPASIPDVIKVADYHEDKPQFKKDMRKIVKLLRKIKL